MSVDRCGGCLIEIGGDGYLRIDHDAARRFFPEDVLVPLVQGELVLLLPTRGAAAGGLILKQRNARGDRCVLINEVFGFAPVAGTYDAIWDDPRGGLRMDIKAPATAIVPRPQPVGLGAFPESHLLAAADRTSAGLTSDRTSGRAIDDYNAFVRSPSAEALAALEAAGDPTIIALARAAAFAHGLVDDLPQPGPLDGELKALVLMTAAAGLVEQGAREEACQRLAAAAAAARDVAPEFSALLEMQLADLLPVEQLADAIEHLRSGLRLAEQSTVPLLKAELWMKLGCALQQSGAQGNRAVLLEAVTAYQRALQEGITERDHPESYGQIQNNLGLVYLSTPTGEASDQLRTGIAVQSFRHALQVFDRETHPDMWATVSMNLGNALQYLPSSHPQENLMQAVEIYEDVLAVRAEARDPVAHALVLLNQANALAHLGIFKPAIEKLALAYKLFSWHEQKEQAAAAKELLDQIHARSAELREGEK